MHCTPLTQDLQRQAPHLHRPCPRAAPCPNIAPGRMGCDWPMTDQSAVRCTADMHNAATLLNLVQLSVAVASISTGLIVKLSRAPSGPLVLHGRKLSQVSVSTVAELTAAVGDSAVDKILVAAGTYDFTSDMCSGSAVCIDRALTIEAQVPGSVVLDAKGGRRVFNIQSGGTAELIGLGITGGVVLGMRFEEGAGAGEAREEGDVGRVDVGEQARAVLRGPPGDDLERRGRHAAPGADEAGADGRAGREGQPRVGRAPLRRPRRAIPPHLRRRRRRPTGARALRLHALCALRLLVLPPCLRAPGQRGKLVRERLLVARPSSGS